MIDPIYHDRKTLLGGEFFRFRIPSNNGRDSNWGLIDRKNQEVIPPKFNFEFDLSESLLGDFYTISGKINQKTVFGLIENNGNLILEPKYDSIRP